VAVLAVSSTLSSLGYDLIYGGNQDTGTRRVTWDAGTIPFVIRMSQTANLQDGTSYASSVQAAMNAWNAQVTNVQFSSYATVPGLATDGDGLNEIAFDTKIYSNAANGGEDFGEGTLAVTLSWTTTSPRADGTFQRTQSDILFNSAWTWNSYRGNLQQPEDIRRVAIHELGHVLGLNHPDQDGQTVTAIMNAYVSNIDSLQTDDLTGAQFLYGRTGGFTAPANDNFSSATPITLSGNSATLTASSIGASQEAGEPHHGHNNDGASIWWKWTAPANGTLTVNTLGTNFDTVLAAYTGGSVDSLSQLAANDDTSDTERRSTITITVTNGTTYSFAAAGWDAQWGTVRLSVGFTPANNGVAPSLTSHPSAMTVNTGLAVSFSVTADGTAPLGYQWQVLLPASSTWLNVQNSPSYSGAQSSTLVIQADYSFEGVQLRCVVSNAIGSVTSNPATLTVLLPPRFTSSPADVTLTSVGGTAQFTSSATGRPAPAYRWQRLPAGGSAWADLSNDDSYEGVTTATLSVKNVSFAMNGDQFRCVATNSVASVIGNSGRLNVGLPPVIRTQPIVQTVSEGATFALSVELSQGTQPVTYQWYKDSQAIVGATGASYQVLAATLSAAGSYYVTITNPFGSVASQVTVVTIRAAPPVITTQPVSQAVVAGDPATFRVVASSTATISYSWERKMSGNTDWVRLINGNGITGAATATLTIAETLMSMNRDEFRCVVSNSGDSVLSDVAMLNLSPLYGTVDLAVNDWAGGIALRYDGSLWVTNVQTHARRQIADQVGSFSTALDQVFFIKRDRTLWGVGTNSSGQLGDGATTSRSDPIQIASDVVSVAASQGHTLFLKSDGTLWATGANAYGQLMNGTQTGLLTPVQVAEDVSSISANNSGTFFVKSDGTLWGMGAVSGFVPSASALGRHPMQIADAVLSATVASNYLLYIKTDHTLWHIGWSGQGVAVQVAANVVRASVADYHFVYLKADGELWGGGDNYSGKLGGSGGYYWPVTVKIADGVVSSTAHAGGTAYTKIDGSIWQTGSGVWGGAGLSPAHVVAGDLLAPSPVNDLSATGAANAVRLCWSHTVGAHHYEVLRSETDNIAAAQMVARVDGASMWYDNTAQIGRTYFYWVRAVNPLEAAMPSNSVSGAALSAIIPTVTSQPADATVAYGTNVTLAVTAAGFPAPSYQWQRYNTDAAAWEDIDLDSLHLGVFSSTTQLREVATAQIRCKVHNLAGAIFSAPATLTVVNGPQSPVIVEQPQSKVVPSGSSTNFSVTASGPSLTYLWQISTDGGHVWVEVPYFEIITPGFGGVRPPPPYVGITTPTLSISDSTGQDGRRFRCVVANTDGRVVSTSATLSVLPPPPTITAGLVSQLVQAGSPVQLTVIATSDVPLTYQWSFNGAELSGETAPSLAIADFQVVNAGTYSVRVTNAGGSVTSSATVDVAALPTITAQPESATRYAGENLTLSVTATSNAPISYQWIKSGQVIDGATQASLQFTPVRSADAGDYSVEVTTLAGAVRSSTATVTVLSSVAPVITEQPQSKTVAWQAPTSFTIAATGSPAPTYQWQRLPVGTNTWVNVERGVSDFYTGVDTPTLMLWVGTLLGNDGDKFRCVVSNLAGTVTSDTATLRVSAQGAVVAAASANGAAWFTRVDGSLWSMGANGVGQLADGTNNRRSTPAAASLASVARVDHGFEHVLVVKSDGALWVSGDNQNGQLGDGTYLNRSNPVQVANGVAAAAGGYRHSLFRKSDGTLWSMGRNDVGQLCDGTTTQRAAPVQVAASVISVAAGFTHSIYVRSDHTAWGAGSNNRGQLGNGTTTSVAVPTHVASQIADVATFYHTLWLKTDGTLWASGRNDRGQLGDGSQIDRLTPVQIAHDVVAVSVGELHSLFLKSDGSLWAMGANDRGQLGDGSLVDQLSPVMVATQVASIAAGLFQSYYVTTDGTLFASGRNDQGQLGDGSFVDRASYIQVSSGAGGLPRDITHANATNSDLLDRVSLSWMHSRGALYYRVWRNSANDSTVATLLADRVKGNFYEDWSGTPGLNYYYWVQPVNQFGALPVGASSMGRQGASGIAPSITAQPVSQSVAAGADVTFNITADGTAPLTYQWRKAGQPIASAHGSSYTISSVQLGAAGDYDVVVTNPYGIAISNAATLTINRLAQTITFAAIADRTYATRPLELNASASSGLTVTFSVVSGPATVNGDQLTLTGAGTVTIRASQSGDATYAAAPDVERSFVVHENADSWQRGHFSESELLDPSVSGPNADPDRDGIPNLIEYALGLDPRASTDGALPPVTVTETDWSYTYSRPVDRSDLTYTVEYSVDLVNWSPVSGEHRRTAGSDGVETWTATQPRTATPNCYFRLAVTRGAAGE